MREHLVNERALLAKTIDYRLALEDLDALFAMIEGLRVAVCVPARPLPLPRARQILEMHVRQALADAA